MRIFMLAVVFLSLGVSIASKPSAQSWITREACTVTTEDLANVDETILTERNIVERSKATPYGVGKLWKITSPAGAVSHIWGTTHSSQTVALNLPDRVLALIEAAQFVAVEYDPTRRSRAELTADNAGADWFDFGPHVDLEAIPDHIENWIDLRLQALGGEPGVYRELAPAILAELLLGSPCEDFASGWLPIQDGRIAMLGMLAGAQIVGLEDTFDFRKRLDGPGGNEIATAIIASYGTYLDPKVYGENLALPFKLYLQGRVAEDELFDRTEIIAHLDAGQGRALYTIMDDYLIVERNQNFLEVALPLTEQGNAFIAFGSFHLPGETGLPAMFAAKGYNVERVWVAGEVR